MVDLVLSVVWVVAVVSPVLWVKCLQYVRCISVVSDRWNAELVCLLFHVRLFQCCWLAVANDTSAVAPHPHHGSFVLLSCSCAVCISVVKTALIASRFFSSTTKHNNNIFITAFCYSYRTQCDGQMVANNDIYKCILHKNKHNTRYIQNSDSMVISLASTHESTAKIGPVNFRRVFIYDLIFARGHHSDCSHSN